MWIWDWIKNLFVSSNNPGTPVKSVSDMKLGRILKGQLPTARFELADENYAVVKKNWLLHPFYNYYKKVLKGLKISGWTEDFDCDDFARLFFSIAQACHAKGNTKNQGISVGLMFYVEEEEYGMIYGHAINVAIVDDDLSVIFIEPQTGKEKCLTESERESCWFVYF